jgi:TRAP-type C4-dicarboxylate transport system substrate-binding protein
MPRLYFLAAAAVASLLVGCSGAPDRTGGVGDDEPRVLRLANGNFLPGSLRAFADEVRRRSNGTLRIEFANEWRKGQVRYEAGIIDDVRRGKVDLGWVGARAWTALGVHSFDALLAPFLVDGHDLQRRAIAELGDEMLAGATGAGVHPIALLPGPMRRVVAREPVTSPDDLAGRRLLIQAGAIEESALRALGAEPIARPSGVKLGDLDGAVQQMASIAANRYERDARFITADLALWPRPLVVFASPAAWDRLSERQRTVLEEAGRAAAPAMVAAERDEEATGTQDACAGGARLVRAGARGRAAMRAAVEPVYRDLRDDAATARAIAAIERLRASAKAEPVPACGPPATRPREGGISPGTYVFTITREDARGLPSDSQFRRMRRRRFRAVFTPGHVVLYESTDGGPEEIGLEADYTVFRDRFETREANGATMKMRWSFDGKRLRFTDIDGIGPDDDVVWGSHPWVKVR